MDEIGKLGFGFMRLPVVEGDGGKEIDIEQVKHMVDLFMDAGFTYFDTARGYHNGRSEAALREAVDAASQARRTSRCTSFAAPYRRASAPVREPATVASMSAIRSRSCEASRSSLLTALAE